MTPAELYDALDRLGLSQAGAARLFRVNPRTVRRWQDGDVPVPWVIGFVLRLMIDRRISMRDFT